MDEYPKGVFRLFVLNGGMKAMRFAARALVAGILMVCCRGAVAAESGSSWWPFGHHADATAAQPPIAGQTTLPPATSALATGDHAACRRWARRARSTDADDGIRRQSLDAQHSEEESKLALAAHAVDAESRCRANQQPEASKNKWADKAPVTPKTSPMQSVKNGANSVAAGTKSAWHKTVAAVTPGPSTKNGSETGARPASR